MEIYVPLVPYNINDNSILVLDNNIIKEHFNFIYSLSINIRIKNSKLFSVKYEDPILEEVKVSDSNTIVVRNFEVGGIPKLVPRYIVARSKLSNTMTDYADYKLDLARLSIDKEELGNIVLSFVKTIPISSTTAKLVVWLKFIDNKLQLSIEKTYPFSLKQDKCISGIKDCIYSLTTDLVWE